MHWFLAVYYFILPLLHVSTCVSSSGRSAVPAELHSNLMQWLIRLCVIRFYVSVMWTPGMHRSVWLCVSYVEAWYELICLVMCLLYGRLVCTDLSGYVSVMWRPGMNRSAWLCVCYVDAWYAPICLVTCLLCGGLVCTELSGYVSVMWRPGMHRSVWLRVCYVEAWYAPICLVTCLLCGDLVCTDLSGYVAESALGNVTRQIGAHQAST
jgi:hypothetical protein